ncbi:MULTISPECIES: hypothetical protein [unclassified Thiocapsa]|uniref:hypothetical protein n=1 Tax=unclassified Thiocapsa TaxID=2641286 RepID=UPI0035AE7087
METSAPFEIRIVQVHWASSGKPLDVETAWSPTLLVENGLEGYTADITAYPEVSFRRPGQIGILAPGLTSPPVLVLGGGESVQELSPVKASDGRTWWIERGKWKKSDNGGYHDSKLCRHAGMAHLRVGSVDLRLRISMPGFNEQEFETLLGEFRNGLWQLILERESPVTVSARQADGGVNDAFLEAVRDHIRHAEHALAQPHLELRERTEQQPLTKVRPMMRTFQELALRGAPRWVSGRGHAPSYDTPENRLLLAMTVRLNRSLRSLLQAANDMAVDFDRRAGAAEAHAKSLNGWVKVVPEKLEQELAELHFRSGALEVARDSVLSRCHQGECLHEIKFRVNKRNKRDEDQDHKDERYGRFGFWSSLISVAGQPREKQELRLVFDRKIMDLVKCVFIAHEIYTVRGRFSKQRDGENSQGIWVIANVEKLCSIESSLEDKIAAEINRLTDEKQRLEGSDYWHRLSSSAVRDQEKDRQAHQSQAQRFRTESAHWQATSEALKPLLTQTNKVIERAKSLRISTGQNLAVSGSMTYVQNPDYRGALAAFRIALDAANLDVSKIDQLFRLDEIGILDMPRVYERWCFLKLVRILREHYGFVPTGAYQEDLFKGLADHDYWNQKRSNEPIRIFFEGPHLNRDVLLEYEPLLPTGKRPDFVVTVLARRQESTRTEPTDAAFNIGALNSHVTDRIYHDSEHFNQDAQDPGPFDPAWFGYEVSNSSLSDEVSSDTHPIDQMKLILDAKCKRFAPIASNREGMKLDSELEELIVRRHYDEEGANRVFVLHPGYDAESANESGGFCRYGGGHFTSDPDNRPEWDQAPPDHRHGAVLLRPGVIDPLIRLITMHLYLNWEYTADDYAEKPPRYQPFCPACGEASTTETPPPGKPLSLKRGMARALWCANLQCSHLIVRNHCWNCGTHLWKLGGYWTFHETRALNPYDIKCPHCGEYLIIPEQELESEAGSEANDSYFVY